MTTVPVTGKAASLLNDGKAQPAHGDAPLVVERDGPMPLAIKGSRADDLVTKMEKLKPGKWLEFQASKIKKTTLYPKMLRARKKNKNLSMYPTEDGRFIVYIGAGK